ncbi:MAG: hypothetical protein ACXWMF_04040 [Syntrophales bacterium]
MDEEGKLNYIRVRHREEHAVGDGGVTQFGLKVHRRTETSANPLYACPLVDGGQTLYGGLWFIGVVHPRECLEIGIAARRHGHDILFLIEGRTGP